MENQPINNSSDISSTNPPVVNQPSISIQTKTNLMMPILVTLLASAILFGGGGYYLGKQSSVVSQQSPSVYISPSPANSAVSSPTTSPLESTQPNTNLKSYTDPFNTFTFNYPNNFVVQGGIYQGGYNNKELLVTLQVVGTEYSRPSNQLSITTRKTSGLDTFLDDIYALKLGETWSNPNFAPKYTRIADSTVAGITAHNYSQSGDSEGQDRMAILNKNGKYYIFMYGSKNPTNLQQSSPEYGVDFSKAFNQVFSTLKFL